MATQINAVSKIRVIDTDTAKLNFIDSVMSLSKHGFLFPAGKGRVSDDELLETVTLGGEFRFVVFSADLMKTMSQVMLLRKHVGRGFLTVSDAMQVLTVAVGNFSALKKFVEAEFPDVISSPYYPDGCATFLDSCIEWLNPESESSDRSNRIKISTATHFLEQFVSVDDRNAPERAADRLWSSLEALEAAQVCKIHRESINKQDLCPGVVVEIQFMSQVESEALKSFEQAYHAW